MLATFFLFHFFHFFYLGHPWYAAGVWGNVFVILILAPFGYLWSKAKFWPLRPLEHAAKEASEKLDRLHESHAKLLTSHEHLLQRLEDLHDKIDAAASGGDPHDTKDGESAE